MAKLAFDITANDGVSRVLDNIESRYVKLEKVASKAGVTVKQSLSADVSSVKDLGHSLQMQIDVIKSYKNQLNNLATRRTAILSKGSGISSSESAELLRINKAYKEITESIREEENALKGLAKTFTASMKSCDKELDRFDDELTKTAVKGGASKLKDSLASIGKLAAGVFTVNKLKDFAQKTAQVRGEMQSLEAAFTTMLGTREAAQTLLQQSVEFAATTPFDLQQVAKGAKQLLAFGTAQENVLDDMRMLGDVAAGLTIPIGDLIYLYGTLRAQGRVMTVDIRQFAMRGIPIYDELAKVLGVAKNEIQEMVSSGAVTFEHVEKAFKNMTSEGGKFAGLTQGIAGTIQGRISNLGDSIYQMYNEIGQKTEGIINAVLSVAAIAVENYDKIGKAIGAIITAYGTYRAALMLNAAVSKAVTARAIANNAAEAASVGGVTTAYLAKMKLLRSVAFLKSGGGMLSIVAGLTAGVIKYNMAIVNGTLAQKAYNKRVKEQNRLIEENAKKAQQLLSAIQRTTEGSEERNEAIDKLVESYPELLDMYDREKIALMDIKRLNEDIERIQSTRTFNSDMARLEELRARLVILNRNAEDFKAAGGEGLQSIRKRIRDVEYEIAAIEEKYGESLFNGPPKPTGAGTGEGEEAEVKNKEYWEKRKQAAEKALEALASDKLATKEAKKLFAELAEAERELEKYDFNKDKTTKKETKKEPAEDPNDALLEQKKKFDKFVETYAGFKTRLNAINKKFEDDRNYALVNSKDIDQQQEWLKEIERVYEEELMNLYETVQTEGAKVKAEWTDVLGGPEVSPEEWIKSLSTKSLDTLTQELKALETMLLALGRMGQVSEEDMASLKKMIELIKGAIGGGNEGGTDKSKWTDLAQVLNGVGSAFESAGDKMGGVLGKVIGLVGELSTGVAKMGVAIEGLKSEDKSEKLTAGLNIASMAISGLASLTAMTNESMERSLELTRMALEYQNTIERLRREKERAGYANSFGTDAYSQFAIDYDTVRKEGYKSAKLIEEVFGNTIYGALGQLDYSDIWERFWGAQEGVLKSDMRTDWDKFWGSQGNIITKNWSDFFTNGEFQGDELREWFETYKDGLDETTRAYLENVLAEWDAYEEALGRVEEYISNLVNNISGTLANDMVEQFLETGSAILDMSEYMDDFSKSIAKSIVQSMLLKEVFTNEMQDEIAKLIAGGDTEGAIDLYNQLLEQANALAPDIQHFLEGVGLEGGSKMPDSSGGFQTMSQETGTELNGRFTAVQISSEATRAAVEAMSKQFDSFYIVYSNRGIVVDDIRNIQAQALLELVAINENTKTVIKPIKEMNATMTEMNAKIKTL